MKANRPSSRRRNNSRRWQDERVAAFIRKKMSDGLSYPVALCESVGELYGKKESEILSSPNSTLAVEYIRAIKKLSYDVKLLPVKRKGSGHDSEEVYKVI